MKKILIFLLLISSTIICAANGSNPQPPGSPIITIVVDDTNATNTLYLDSATFLALTQWLLDETDYSKGHDNFTAESKCTYSDNKSIHGFVVLIWLALLTALLLFLLVYYFLYDKRNRRSDVIAYVCGSDRVQNFILRIITANQNLNSNSVSSASFISLSKRVDEIEKKVDEQARRSIHEPPALSTSVQSVADSKTTAKVADLKFFAESIQDGRYVKVSDTQSGDSIFELTVRQGSNFASVTICKSAYQKILANPSFIEGCNKQVEGKSRVEIKEEGAAERKPDGKWIVCRPIKVVLR